MPSHKERKYDKRADQYQRIVGSLLIPKLPVRKEPDVNAVLLLLSTSKPEVLKIFMQKNNFFLFEWALENENLDLIDMLLRKIRPEDHFLMVEYGNYKYVKKFIRKQLEEGYEHYEDSLSKKKEILFKLIQIDPKLMIEVINLYLEEIQKDHSTDNNHRVMSSLKGYLQQIRIVLGLEKGKTPAVNQETKSFGTFNSGLFGSTKRTTSGKEISEVSMNVNEIKPK